MLPRFSRIVLGRELRPVALLFAVGMLDAQHDQPRVHVVGHVLPRVRHWVHAGEVALLLQVLAQPPVQLGHHLVRLALELLRPVLGQFRHRRLSGVPVARAVLVQVRRRACQPPQRIAEHRGRLAGHHAPQLDPPVLQRPGARPARSARSPGRSSAPPAGSPHTCRGSAPRHPSAAAASSARPRPSRSPAPSCPTGSASARTGRADRRSGCSRAGSALLRSSLAHRLWMTAAIRRNTPRVRWNLTSVDQSV